MTAAPTAERPGALEQRLDEIAAQVAFLAEQARAEQERREARAELWADLTPVATEAFDTATRELDALASEVTTDDLSRLARQALRNARNLEALLEQLDSLSELARDATPLARDVMMAATEHLDRLEQRGYLTFVRGGAAVVDRVVTSFGEDDLRALGDNVVLILETVKEMTQPEVMAMLGRVAHVAREDEPERVSLLTLLRRMNDPAVRRGLNRLLNVLESLGERSTAPPGPTAARGPAPTTH